MSQALYRKWRPARFDHIVGQQHITRTLQNSVAADRIGHAYLFSGPRGTGKTTMARLLAKAVNCLFDDPTQRPCDQCENCLSINHGRFLDLIEIDAASNTGVDDIRDLRDKIGFSPARGRMKVYIIDEVHMLSTAAFNALLKTLEEPPAHAMFILATTEEHKLPLTIKSRCQQFNFRLLTIDEIEQRLNWLAKQESLTIEPQAMYLIARQASGSIRDAESLLDQLIISPDESITLSYAQTVLGAAPDASINALVDAWLDGDGGRGLHTLQDALSRGASARQFAQQIVGHLRKLLLLQAAGSDLDIEETADQKEIMLAQARRAPRDQLITAVRQFHEAALKPSGSWQPQLPLELAFIDLLPAQAPVEAGATNVNSKPPAPSAEAALIREPAPVLQEREQTTAEPPSPSEEKQVARDDATSDAASNPEPPIVREDKSPESASIKLSLGQVQSQWEAMRHRIGDQNKNLPPLLAMSKPLAVEADTLILGFDYPILKEKFDKTEGATTTVAAAFSDLTGHRCTVRSVLTSEYVVPIDKAEFEALADELGGVVYEE